MKNRFEMIVSDESVNKYGYRVLTKGIDVKEFKRNPVMFYNHKRGDGFFVTDDVLPVGRWENIKKENGKLKATAVLDLNDELGRKIAQKMTDGFLNAASIGIGISAVSEKNMVDGQTRPTVTKSVLQEISIVDIPANGNAMKLSFGGSSVFLSNEFDESELDKIFQSMNEDMNEEVVESTEETTVELNEGTEDNKLQSMFRGFFDKLQGAFNITAKDEDQDETVQGLVDELNIELNSIELPDVAELKAEFSKDVEELRSMVIGQNEVIEAQGKVIEELKSTNETLNSIKSNLDATITELKSELIDMKGASMVETPSEDRENLAAPKEEIKKETNTVFDSFNNLFEQRQNFK